MLAPDTHLRDRYRILCQIGRGGFGTVYKAVDEVFGCSVAIKETREEVVGHERLQKAFEREAKLLRNLKHECLPRVTDYFLKDNAQYLVMDFIEGEDLASLLKRRIANGGPPFNFSELLPWAERVLSALEYLHSLPEPIIHRDIKPSNIKLGSDGEIYLLDFGLAKGVAGQMSTVQEGQSSFSIAAFTQEYAPLEQLQESGTRPQSDIYAFGATLYHLLTGQIPIAASKRDEMIQRSLGDPLRLAHEVNSSVPFTISKIIEKAMIVRWWDRMASAAEMRKTLISAAAEVGIPALDRSPENPPTDAPAKSSWQDLATTPMTPRDNAISPRVSAVTVPTKTALPPRQSRKRWLVATFGALVVLMVTAIGLRLRFPEWFDRNRSATTNQSAATSEALTSPTSASDFRLANSVSRHQGVVWAVAFSPKGRLVASGGNDGKVFLWDADDWNASSPLAEQKGPIYSLAFSRDGKMLAVPGEGSVITLWNVETRQIKNRIEEGTEPIFRVVFSPDNSQGNILASVSGVEPKAGGDEIRVWYERDSWTTKILPYDGSQNKLYAIAFSPDGRSLAGAGYGNAICLWDLKDTRRKDLFINQAATGFVNKLAFSPDGKYLAAGLSDGSIKLWHTDSWDQVESLDNEHRTTITALVFSPDSSRLVSASGISNPIVRLWTIAAGTSKQLTKNARTVVLSLAFSDDGRMLLGSMDDGTIAVWEAIQH